MCGRLPDDPWRYDAALGNASGTRPSLGRRSDSTFARAVDGHNAFVAQVPFVIPP